MGCAGSNPLVDGGKAALETAKETTEHAINSGEKAMHDAGEAVSSATEHVKTAIESGLHTAQNSIGNVVGNIESTMHLTKSHVNDGMETVSTAVEENVTKTSHGIDEAISDTKTMLVDDDEVDTISTTATLDKEESPKHEFGEIVGELERTTEETLHVEDMENNAEEVVAASVAEVPVGKPTAAKAEEKKEKPITSWEAAADEILRLSRMKSVDSTVYPTMILDEGVVYTGGDIVKNKECTSGSDILLSDTISVKSYKSEI